MIFGKKAIIFLTLLSSNSFAISSSDLCQDSPENKCVTPFGSVIGSVDNTPAFSNCRSECVQKDSPQKVPAAEIEAKEDVYSGLSWQCVEYARRWWMLNLGIKFGSVNTADQIFDIQHATRIVDNHEIKVKQHKNSSHIPPKVGNLLIYAKQKDNINFQYGHVAVIVKVNLNKGYIDLAEQNYNNKKWESENSHSRRIALTFEDGKYTTFDISKKNFNNTLNNKTEKEKILGWIDAFSDDYAYEKCEDLKCVRAEIDSINKDIVEMLALRMRYVYQAGDIKMKNNKFTASDKKRADEVFLQVETLASQYGLEKKYARKIFDIIVNDSISYEQKYIDKKKLH